MIHCDRMSRKTFLDISSRYIVSSVVKSLHCNVLTNFSFQLIGAEMYCFKLYHRPDVATSASDPTTSGELITSQLNVYRLRCCELVVWWCCAVLRSAGSDHTDRTVVSDP